MMYGTMTPSAQKKTSGAWPSWEKSWVVTGQGSITSVRCDLKTMCKSRKYRSTSISGKDDEWLNKLHTVQESHAQICRVSSFKMFAGLAAECDWFAVICVFKSYVYQATAILHCVKSGGHGLLGLVC